MPQECTVLDDASRIGTDACAAGSRRVYWACRSWFLLTCILLTLSQGTPSLATERERTTCPGESGAFFSWSSIASLTPYWIRGDGKEKIPFTAGDGRKLRGLRLHSTAGAPWGFVLVLQGNAMPAGYFHDLFEPLRGAGLDVFIYDYRGYKGSQGRRRVAAMIEDYREIVAKLSPNYEQRFVYAISYGGLVAVNALEDPSVLDLLVLDSVPASLEPYNLECETDYSPLRRLLSGDCSNVVVAVGSQDSLIRDGISWLSAQSCGGTFVIRPARHPFAENAEDAEARVEWLSEQILAKKKTEAE